jgi:hypothetical protein
MYFLNLSTLSSSNNLGTLSSFISLNSPEVTSADMRSEALAAFPGACESLKNVPKGMIASKSKKQEPFK